MSNITPVIKWAGGKRQLVPIIKEYLGDLSEYNNYFEIFVGGGALLFDLKPPNYFINDYNKELITMYNVIKNNPSELINDLNKHINTKDYYLDIRNADRDGRFELMTDIEVASRFIYLNRSGYNGLYRVNKKGQFNVPYANPKVLNFNIDNIYNVSRYLNDNDGIIKCGDFYDCIDFVKPGDFVYMDPPYIPITSSSFTEYTKDGFGLEDHLRIKSACEKIHKLGGKFILSNSSSPLVYNIFKDFSIAEVNARRSINSKGGSRGPVKEVLISNFFE